MQSCGQRSADATQMHQLWSAHLRHTSQRPADQFGDVTKCSRHPPRLNHRRCENDPGAARAPRGAVKAHRPLQRKRVPIRCTLPMANRATTPATHAEYPSRATRVPRCRLALQSLRDAPRRSPERQDADSRETKSPSPSAGCVVPSVLARAPRTRSVESNSFR